ncbi:exported protein of unknown function (plasmid) [Caballeronia sp. S22]
MGTMVSCQTGISAALVFTLICVTTAASEQAPAKTAEEHVTGGNEYRFTLPTNHDGSLGTPPVGNKHSFQATWLYETGVPPGDGNQSSKFVINPTKPSYREAKFWATNTPALKTNPFLEKQREGTEETSGRMRIGAKLDRLRRARRDRGQYTSFRRGKRVTNSNRHNEGAKEDQTDPWYAAPPANTDGRVSCSQRFARSVRRSRSNSRATSISGSVPDSARPKRSASCKAWRHRSVLGRSPPLRSW